MKRIPNLLSGSRILMSISLLWFVPFSRSFMGVYIFAGVTDLVDGPIARKTNSVSNLGANLDGIADLLLGAIAAYVLIPSMQVPRWGTYSVVLIILIRVVSIIIGRVRFKRIVMLHTYGNKAIGLVAWLFPILYLITPTDILVLFVCTVGFLAFIEDLIINCVAREIDPNIKSILSLKGLTQ